jgi:SCY1-like protein 1
MSPQLAASDLQTSIAAGSAAGMESPIPGALAPSSNISELPNKPFSTPPHTPSNLPSSIPTKGKGLQLGGSAKSKLNTSAVADFAKELEDDIAVPGSFGGGAENPWGNDDLLDVNADEDDWGTLSTSFPEADSHVFNLLPLSQVHSKQPLHQK